MTKKMSYRWTLRERMADRGWWKTTDLTPLLAERGIHLSAAQTYRLVAHTPERLSLDVLAALCDILACTPADLIEIHAVEPRAARTGTDETIGDVTKIRAGVRPKRARIT
jgi:DNA-binding Xre family transcriptional regulator